MEKLQEGGFVEGFDAEVGGFAQFGAGVGAGDDKIGFAADGRGDASAGSENTLFGLFASHAFERASQDEALVAQSAPPFRRFRQRLDIEQREQPFDRLAVARLVEPGAETGGDLEANIADGLKIVGTRRP